MIALQAAGIALFGAGHLLRDGWPSFKDMTGGRLGTHAARIGGALLCGAGAYLMYEVPLDAAVISAAVLAGFYFDMKHGDGQGADSIKSILFLALSGVTSVLPAAVAIYFYRHENPAMLLAPALLKPLTWVLAWDALRSKQGTWFQPTRVAAILFGCYFGAACAWLLG